jgi:asparagine synthase (glutamine-hydrolysing)
LRRVRSRANKKRRAESLKKMCGIAGIVAPGPQKPIVMRRMLDALSHRGPDDEATEQDATAILGHRRLSIIDLDGGRQPLTSADGAIWLVCNGEIYNYRELRISLEAEGYRFRTRSDCEVIIALYERHGERLLAHLRGMFSFALWDSRRRRLFAARDHLGQKPFYYAQTPRGFAFASEIKALLAFDRSLGEMNLEALDQYLALRLIAPPHSMFRGVRKLPPGHLLILDEGRLPEIRPYWDLDFEPKLSGPEGSLIDELEERLIEAVSLHMVSDVPVGALLSGGLDSSLLVGILAKRVGVKDLPTFTVGLPHSRFDEAPHARAVARTFGTRHHEESLAPRLVSLLPHVIHHLDEPSDPLSLCSYHLAHFARQHVKVVIGGDGGDELFGGYDRYYGNVYASHYGRIPAPLRRHVLGPLLPLVPEVGWYKSVGHQMRWLHRLSFLSGGERYAASLSYFYFDREHRRALFTPDALTALGKADAESAIREPYERAGCTDAIDRMLYADSKVRLPDHPVMITDRTSMAHGLETRSPFMDHRLVEFGARLRSTMKIRGRSLRIVQRTLAARYLPEKVLARPKQGFASALPYILQHEYRLLYDRFLTRSALVREGILRREPIQELLSSHLSGRADHGNRLWLLINAELWYRLKIQGVSRDSLLAELSDPELAPSDPTLPDQRIPATGRVASQSA